MTRTKSRPARHALRCEYARDDFIGGFTRGRYASRITGASVMRHSTEAICNVTVPQHFPVVIERDAEGFFVATVPALPGCHTQARSMDDLEIRVKEAIELCLAVRNARS